MENLLNHLEQKAISAHNWTSFSPEIRGKQMIEGYNAELNEDLNELRAQGVAPETLNEYKLRYERLLSSYIGAKSNCFSAMITGPARFNTRKHEKANRSEQKHYEIFREWREKAKKAIIKKMQPVKTFSSELERYRADLEYMQKNHELMKEGNKKIKDALKLGYNIDDYLTTTFGIKPHMLEWTMKFGFGLTNNNANMKRVEQRIKELEAKEAKRQDSPETKIKFEGGEILLNYEDDRIQVFFDSRPTREELQEWKQKGLNSYNWSPSNNCWQRKITANAIWSAKRTFNVNI